MVSTHAYHADSSTLVVVGVVVLVMLGWRGHHLCRVSAGDTTVVVHCCVSAGDATVVVHCRHHAG